MKIHHLNCGTCRPLGGSLLNRSPSIITCHCLLIDTDKELVLVDSGVGMADMKNPKRLGPMHLMLNLRQDDADTAFRQVEQLGYNPEDVKHIIITHLDLDHAGGLPDFPWANVHVLKQEYDAAMHPENYRERERYRKCHFAHQPKWILHEKISDEKWFGLECIRGEGGLPEDIVIVPLTGHTKGHCGVAIKMDESWFFHAGDTYYYDKQMANPIDCTIGFKLFEYLAHMDKKEAIKKKNRLWDVIDKNRDQITICCTHDPTEFETLSKTTLRRRRT
ncbi:MAG: MBL fold metallo-hydrolase [Proteobacteria bacterium]|nr:MBL fold metallo-hydrolase [Pseudomonadota bacterium]